MTHTKCNICVINNKEFKLKYKDTWSTKDDKHIVHKIIKLK